MLPQTQRRFTHHRFVPKQNLVYSIKYIFIAEEFVVDKKVKVVVVLMLFLSWLNINLNNVDLSSF